MPDYGFSIVIEAKNYAKIRKALTTMASPEWYRGIIRDTARITLEDWVQFAKTITHRSSGQLALSHKWEYDSHLSTGKVFIDPRSVRLSGKSTIKWAKIYGPYEHARGGTHAFYARTLAARGTFAVEAGFKALVSGVPKA